MSVAEIEHAVERAQQRVQLVRAEQHGDAELRSATTSASSTTVLWWCGSRLISGSSSSSSRGRPSSACASSRRWRSPPEISARGRRASVARADQVERAVDLAAAARLGNGRPRRWPSTALGDEVPAAQAHGGQSRRDSAACSRRRGCRASPAGRAPRCAPWLRRERGRASARISVVLPAPLAPSTPTNSHFAISRVMPVEDRRGRRVSRWTSRNSIAFTRSVTAARVSTASSSSIIQAW